MGRLRRSLLLLVLVVLASGGLPWPFVGGQITNSAQQSLQEFPAWANKGPDCSGVENWATSMAFVHLKNAGINDNANVDFTNTKTTRMTSERLEEDLWVATSELPPHRRPSLLRKTEWPFQRTRL